MDRKASGLIIATMTVVICGSASDSFAILAPATEAATNLDIRCFYDRLAPYGDWREHARRRPADAVFEGSLLRFRPIMMTTMAALMGTLPIALGFGAGAEARRPLGLAVVGGLFFSQFVTLYITPVIYIYLDRVQNRLARRPRP